MSSINFLPPGLSRSISVLIIAAPGSFRDGLSALVSVIPSVGIISHEASGENAIKNIRQHQPALVLLDGDLPGEGIPILLPELRKLSPGATFLVLVGDVSEQEAIKRASADDVLIKGIHAQKLIATIEEILSK